MAFSFTIGGFLQFMQDMPFAQIGADVAQGGMNIPMDFATGEAILAAAMKDFAAAPPSAPVATNPAVHAPATVAAITAATSGP